MAKLTKKKNGRGALTSYSISISLTEAKSLELIDEMENQKNYRKL